MPPVKPENQQASPQQRGNQPPRPQGDKREGKAQDGKPNKRPFRPGGAQGGGVGGGQNVGMPKESRFERYDKFQIPGPTTNLPTRDGEPKKFTGRCRLFIGNLTNDITEEEFKHMFEKYGAVSETFLNKQKGFGFVKMDTKQHAEQAKAELDGTQRNGRIIRVRFATHGAALRVRNLGTWVSNELLEKAFSLFGEIERAVVIVDDRGRSVGEGIVEFARKPGAQMALKKCSEGCFLLCSSPRAIIVEPLEHKDEEDGLQEKNMPKTNQYMKERDIGPRFAHPNSFEYEFAMRWKQLYELEKQKREALEKEIRDDRERLEEQMEFAVYEQETNVLREKLRQREQDANNLLREREMRRREQERQREEMLARQEEMMRQDSFMGRGEELKRRQEDNLLLQANHLNDLLNQPEYAYGRETGQRKPRTHQRHQGGRSGSPTSLAQPDSLPIEGQLEQEAAIRQMQGSGAANLNNMSGNMSGIGSNNMSSNMNNAAMAGMGNNGGFDGQSLTGRSGPMGSGPLPPRQSRFDQPPQGPMGPGPRGGPMGPGGPMGGMSDMRGGMGRREMMERRDHRDDYAGEAKRRRY